jgi:DNA-binding transcriptional regulator YdaS (Cro superfamily)
MEKLLKFLNCKPKADQAEFAKACGTTINSMRTAIYKRTVFGSRLCIAIERESDGEVRCEDLDPAPDWEYMRCGGAGPVRS